VAYRDMPAKLAFAFEHEYWTEQGFHCTKAIGETLEDELAELLNL